MMIPPYLAKLRIAKYKVQSAKLKIIFFLRSCESKLLSFILHFSICILHFALEVFKNPGPDLDYGINRLA